MEARGDEENDFSSVIDNLVNMFGHIMSKEVIATLVESCEGDLNLSVDAIMKITNDGNIIPTKDDMPSTSRNINPKTSQKSGPPTSYAAQAAQNRGAIPRQIQRTTMPAQDFWTDQIRQIMTHHNQGTRIMIILRGIPGSGKSYLAKLLIETMVGPAFINYRNHIFSSDDYFMVRGQYQYDKFKLSFAHSWNQDRVRQATEQGLSPVIIDNTNVEVWEMHPYVTTGVKNGYIIEVVEPNTPWAKKANQLFKRNTHHVPLNTIKRMLDNFTENVTGDNLRHSFGLSYPANMVPPVKRLKPTVPIDVEIISFNSEATAMAQESVQESNRLQVQNPSAQIIVPKIIITNSTGQQEEQRNSEHLARDQNEHQPQSTESTINEVDCLTQEEQVKQKLVQEAQKRLEELEKFEEEWENGEEWDENDKIDTVTTTITYNSGTVSITTTSSPTSETVVTSSKSTTSMISNLESKPPRKEKNAGNLEEGLMQSVNDCKDWRDISIFMPPWVLPEEQPNIASVTEIPIEKTTSSTCMEMYDTNISGKHKVIIATARNINEFYIAPEREKIPDKRMLDKSTMTNDGIMMAFHCPQKERHFVAFRNLFKYIERESLRYIFDNCCGDANWAVENILGGGAKYNLKSTEDDEESELEEESDLGNEPPCTCLANYEITPNASKFDVTQLNPTVEVTDETTGSSVTQLERKRRDFIISEENMQLKRQIEQNVVISDSHYSEHCLKIRKMRRGEPIKVDDIIDQPSTSGLQEGSSTVPDSSNAPNIDSSDDEDGTSSNISETDRIVNINVGQSFIKDLDVMFGRKDMEYPENILFNISIPTSLLNEINALWMESMMFQLDENAKKSAAMVKQDEEFARQLALKEEELMLAGKEPDVPDFKEIMDLEMAINLHLKDVSEWRNNIPNDLAAKMTHEKLFNLFPDVEKDILLEMLMAHDNNFKATVETLLMSVGRNDVLEEENGLNKFVMKKELERQEKLLEEQRKALSEVEWPALPKGEKVEMSTVQSYRDEAEKHLNRRNLNMQKAEDYIRRGMIQVANYCSDLANFHKSKYEQANSKAVASLMQYHANNNPDGETVDLHYFRVKEAKEAMDLFIDTHIQRLRETNKRNITLFFITGRGLHSHGLPRVKPACIKRLRERGLYYSECNPGLLRSRVSCDDKLTYQIP